MERIEIGDEVKVFPGQYLGRYPSKVIIAGKVIEVDKWSWIEQSSVEVRCKPQSRPFLVNLKHSKVEVTHKKQS